MVATEGRGGRMADGLLEAVRGLHLAHTGWCGAWEAGPRSAAELREAATHYDRVAALEHAPEVKAALADFAAQCRIRAMQRS